MSVYTLKGFRDKNAIDKKVVMLNLHIDLLNDNPCFQDYETKDSVFNIFVLIAEHVLKGSGILIEYYDGSIVEKGLNVTKTFYDGFFKASVQFNEGDIYLTFANNSFWSDNAIEITADGEMTYKTVTYNKEDETYSIVNHEEQLSDYQISILNKIKEIKL